MDVDALTEGVFYGIFICFKWSFYLNRLPKADRENKVESIRTASFAKSVAMSLTFSRLPIGFGVAWLLYQGRFTEGLGLYVLGLLTDVLDGTVARAGKCTSAQGAEWDRRLDIVFNAMSAAGYIAGAYLVWGNLHWALGPFVSMAGLVVVTRPFFQPHSAASKLRSGVIRILLPAFIAARLQWTCVDFSIIAALVAFGIPAAIHEIKLTQEEVRTGKRRWFKRPLAQ